MPIEDKLKVRPPAPRFYLYCLDLASIRTGGTSDTNDGIYLFCLDLVSIRAGGTSDTNNGTVGLVIDNSSGLFGFDLALRTDGGDV